MKRESKKIRTRFIRRKDLKENIKRSEIFSQVAQSYNIMR